MKLYSDIDIVVFLNDVKKCKNEVFFETDEGDKLNLKSALSQYVFFVADNNFKIIEKGQLMFEDEDLGILKKYLSYND